MRAWLGIDLGSTTSKAVVVDDGGRVLGRGLTNTRSNYDVAAEVARREAVDDARLGLLGASLAGLLCDDEIAQLRLGYGVAQALERLDRLRLRTVELVHVTSREHARAVDACFGRIADDADAVFGPLAVDRTRFFRDVAGARFYAELDAAAHRMELDYDVASGAYDRAIVEVENHEQPLAFVDLLDRAVGRMALDERRQTEVRRALAVDELCGDDQLQLASTVGTGYGRQRLPFPREQIQSEILCHGLGAHALYPRTRTVLDIGGQDTKAIQLDESGLVTSFQMNDRCAAGCGRYLGYIADEMSLGVHELGPLALAGTRSVKISSTCTVFAGVELRELLATGERRENILLGLHRAIVLRAMGLVARSGGVRDELTFTGGVAKNAAILHAVREFVGEHYGPRTINVHPDSIYVGALGAALFARRGHAEVAA